jgi:two-component system, NarL family, sensor histidine kinase UhpB
MSDTPTQLPICILHLEDSVLDHQLAQRALAKAGLACKLRRVDTLAEFEHHLRQEPTDVILADYNLQGFTALDAWAALQQHATKAPFILLSGAIGERAAVEAIKLGVSDYLSKSDLVRLGPVIQRALDVHQTQLDKARADLELAASEKRLAEFAAQLQRAIEKERAAIAREIHDEVGGALAAIGFDLAWITRNNQDPLTLEHVRQASGMLQQALAASQSIMMNLRPAILDQGLVAALEWLCAGFEKRNGIPTQLTSSSYANLASPEFARGIELTAYRTAQEALTNIAKHATCSRVKVDISDAGGVLTLEVADNGCGIAQAALAKPKSFGLKGLSERARTVGGWLDISSRVGNTGSGGDSGTSIILSIPLDALDSSLLDSQFAPSEGVAS